MIRSLKLAWRCMFRGRQRNEALTSRLDRAIETHAQATEGVRVAAFKTVASSDHVYETVRSTLERMEKTRNEHYAAHS